MNDAQTKELCLALIKADSEEEVISLLKKAGLRPQAVLRTMA
jgi:hypothetical protein